MPEKNKKGLPKIENVESILSMQFDAIMSYNDWTIFKFINKYYVADKDLSEIKEVVLNHITPIDEIWRNIIDFNDDYNGESDDCHFALGFNRI